MKKLKLKDLAAVLDGAPATTKREIAKEAQTSVPTLRQYVAGGRNVSAAKAVLIEKATGVPRENLCEACGACELAKLGRSALAIQERDARMTAVKAARVKK